VAGQARYCSLHPPLVFEPPVFILVGCLDLARFWGPIYNDTLRKLLTRQSNGAPAWVEDKQNSRIVARDESYFIQALPYDNISRLESWNPAFFACDEFFPYEFLGPARQRTWDKNTQLLIAATAFRLLQGEQQWVIHELKNKTAIPEAATQVLSISTLDNEFLEPAARARIARDAEVMRVYNEQAYRVTVLGELEGRQDSCAFTRRAMNKTAPHVRNGNPFWVVTSPPTDDGTRDHYYNGPTRFPIRCELEMPMRQSLLEDRVESQHGGSACYDCPKRCPAFEHPPRGQRFAAFPYVTDQKPKDPGVECFPLSVWVEPNPEHHYALGADVAKGKVGGDYNCVCVIDVTTGEQVAAFREQVSQTVFPAVLAAIWSYYANWGQGGMVIESNSMGYGVIMDTMMSYRVPAEHIFHRADKRRRHILSGAPLVEAGFATTRGSKYGAQSSLETPYGAVEPPILALEHMLASGDLVIHDPILYGEMQTFIRQDGFLGGMDGTHDDTVIAAMLAAFGAQIVSRTLRPIRLREESRGESYNPRFDDELQRGPARPVDAVDFSDTTEDVERALPEAYLDAVGSRFMD
jgi:hypothetical protein